MSSDDNFYTDEAFIAMFDILGFKALRKTKGTLWLSDYYEEIIQGTLQYVEKQYLHITDSTIRYTVFSDTVMLYSNHVSVPTFMVLLAASRELLKIGFSGGGAPFRGAIGVGDLSSKNGILIGSAVEDAYQGEQVQVWSGCMLTPKLLAFLEKNDYNRQFKAAVNFAIQRCRAKGEPYVDQENLLKLLVRYGIPLQEKKSDKPLEYYQKEGIVLDWTQRVDRGAAEKAFLPPQGNHPKKIEQNTLQFEAWACSRGTEEPSANWY